MSPRSLRRTSAAVLRRRRGGGLLVNYAPGDVLPAGATFARNSTAHYVDSAGVVRGITTNALRDAHYHGGFRHTLIEGAATVANPYSENFGLWGTATLVTRTAGQSSPDSGGTNGYLIEASAINGELSDLLAAGALATSTSKGFALRVRKPSVTASSVDLVLTDDSTGTARISFRLTWGATLPIVTSLGAGTFLGYRPLANGFYELNFSSTSVVHTNAHRVRFLLAATGHQLHVWGANLFREPIPTSYVLTNGGAVSRAADYLLFPHSQVASDVTVYARRTNLAEQRGGIYPWMWGDNSVPIFGGASHFREEVRTDYGDNIGALLWTGALANTATMLNGLTYGATTEAAITCEPARTGRLSASGSVNDGEPVTPAAVTATTFTSWYRAGMGIYHGAYRNIMAVGGVRGLPYFRSKLR